MGYGLGNDGETYFAASLGDMQGYYTHTLNVDQIPSHSHTLRGNDRGNNNNQKWAPGLWKDNAETAKTTDPETIQPTGGGAPHNNIQPYTVTNYIIKAIPDEVIQYNPNITAGLSALNGSGQQTTSVDLSTTEIGLNVTSDFSYTGAGSLQIATGAVTPGKLSTGAPNWNENGTLTTGAIFTNGEAVEVNYWGSGDRNAYIDFHSQGAVGDSGYDYDARLFRYPGVDGKFELTNKGTGPITVDRTIAQINTDDKSIATKEYVDANSPIIAGSVAADGTVNTGTGFTSVRNSEGRYNITLPNAGTGKIWMLTANAHSVSQSGSGTTKGFEPHVVELVYVNNNNIQLNVKIGNYNGGWVAQYQDAIVNFIAVKSDV